MFAHCNSEAMEDFFHMITTYLGGNRPRKSHFANMDDTFYSEILTFYTASEYKYPSYIYNTPMNQRPDVKSKFRQSVKTYKVEDGIVNF